MIKIKPETFEEMMPDLKKLCYDHHREVEDGEWELEPDYEAYIQNDRIGNTLCTTVRDGDKLVGYSVEFIGANMHYKGKVTAHNDMIYLSPEYRHLGLLKKLITFIRDELRGEADLHLINLKTNHPCKAMMQELGYENQEITWMARI